MSAAANALPRHLDGASKRTAPFAQHEVKWRKQAFQEGWSMTPNESFRKMLGALRQRSPLGIEIVFHVFSETVGAQVSGVHPETIALKKAALARMFDVSPNAIIETLALLVGMEILFTQGEGAKKKYGCNIEAWGKLQRAGARKLAIVKKPEPVETEDEEAAEIDDAPVAALRRMKANEALVILPGENSKPRPLSELCKNADCALKRGGDDKANKIANKAVEPKNIHLEMYKSSPEATAAHERFVSKLKAGTQEVFRDRTRPVSLVDGVLTLAVEDQFMAEDYENWGSKESYSEATVRAAGLKRVTYIADPALFPPPAPENRRNEPAVAKADERSAIREWMLNLPMTGALADSDVDAFHALVHLPLEQAFAAGNVACHRKNKPIRSYSGLISVVEEARVAFLQKHKYRGDSLWGRARNSHPTAAH